MKIELEKIPGDLINVWNSTPAKITPNNFVYKSLSCWAYNIAVGCEHGCTFCYVPGVSVGKGAIKTKLQTEYGVADPDLQWGEYVALRKWDGNAFGASLRAAESTPIAKLNADGNRAVMLCTTTDPYQVIRHKDAKRRADLTQLSATLVRGALYEILFHSTLNVRILTRSPLAKRDFDIFKLFGNRLVFGMSLPTLNNKLARVYEPNAPAPTQRLETLKAAKAAGLNVYIAMAPTYPECGPEDMRATFAAIKGLNPLTIFHEPINIRAENVSRIEAQAEIEGVDLRTEVFKTPDTWRAYAWDALFMAEELAGEAGLSHCFHAWPDQSLGTFAAMKHAAESIRAQKRVWLQKYWNRVSEWPK